MVYSYKNKTPKGYFFWKKRQQKRCFKQKQQEKQKQTFSIIQEITKIVGNILKKHYNYSPTLWPTLSQLVTILEGLCS